MPVPEQRQLLLERTSGDEHPLGPPDRQTLGLDGIRAQPEKELVDHRLEPAPLALRQHGHAHRRSGFARDAYRVRPALRERVHARVPDRRRVERTCHGVVDRVEVDQRVDRRVGGHRREPLDLGRGGAKSGALNQVRGLVVVPVGGRDGCQVVDPPCGAGAGGRPGIDSDTHRQQQPATGQEGQRSECRPTPAGLGQIARLEDAPVHHRPPRRASPVPRRG